MLIKTIGMTCILISASILGWNIDRMQVYRIEDLEGCRRILYMLYSEVNYSITPLAIALSEILDKHDGRVNCIFYRLINLIEEKSGEGISLLWRESLESMSQLTYLKEEDRKLLLYFGQSLGCLDKEMQKKNIEITLSYIERQISKLEKNHNKNGRLYRSLGILGGCLLCILLL